jgi:para-nitrobenzyl esterase
MIRPIHRTPGMALRMERRSHPDVMYFGQTPHTGPVPGAEGLKMLDAYFAWRRTPEGEARAK